MPQASFPHLRKMNRDRYCPLPCVELPIPIPGDVPFDLPFVLDTGCAVTHIPKSVADALDIEYEKELADKDDCPKTLAGRLTGHVGVLRVTFLTRVLVIPCFVYLPHATIGPAGVRRTTRKVSDMEEYEDEVAGHQPCLLGRLGFLNRFHVHIDAAKTTVSTDPPQPPRSFWSWIAFWR